jgi:DNA-directed RNA polymerase subunit alpha
VAATMSDSAILDTQENEDAAFDLFEKALEAENNLDRWTAIELLRQANEQSPSNPEIAFKLAYHLDLVGEDEEALRLYEVAAAASPAHLNALMNLAVIYEDQGNNVHAERCLRYVIDTNPNHERARMFMKDVLASRSMYYDEEYQRLRDRHSSLLETPVTDFELSARARNCLKKMDVRSIGDLLRISESELMAYKNFGETTLTEIKHMLHTNGLRIGQALHQQQSAAREEVYNQLAEAQGEEAVGILANNVDDLNLSVRSRKALDLLEINTIGDLVARTEAELLGIKNFGATSLDEIKEKLTENGLGLRSLDNS